MRLRPVRPARLRRWAWPPMLRSCWSAAAPYRRAPQAWRVSDHRVSDLSCLRVTDGQDSFPVPQVRSARGRSVGRNLTRRGGCPIGGGEVAAGEAAGRCGEVVGVEVPDGDAVAAADRHRHSVGGRRVSGTGLHVDGDGVSDAGVGGDVVDGQGPVVGQCCEDLAVGAEPESRNEPTGGGEAADWYPTLRGWRGACAQVRAGRAKPSLRRDRGVDPSSRRDIKSERLHSAAAGPRPDRGGPRVPRLSPAPRRPRKPPSCRGPRG